MLNQDMANLSGIEKDNRGDGQVLLVRDHYKDLLGFSEGLPIVRGFKGYLDGHLKS